MGILPPVGPDKPCQLILLKVSPLLGTLMFMARVLFFLFSLLTSTPLRANICETFSSLDISVEGGEVS